MQIKINKPKILLLSLLIIIPFGLTLALIHQVDTSLTNADVTIIEKVSEEFNIETPSSSLTFKEEIAFIRKIQDAVQGLTPHDVGIPFGHTREPEDVYKLRSGLCYDRSRFIEKGLRYYGFNARHVALYSKRRTKNFFRTLIAVRPGSHSISEVETSKGWLLVDSNKPWVSLDKNNKPISATELRDRLNGGSIEWHPEYITYLNEIYAHPFIRIFGLYSRNGNFYPPYNPIPDINWREFLYNFSS